MDTTIIGLIGSVMGIIGVAFSLIAVAKNNAKWSGIVEHKMDTTIENLIKVENRLEKLEDERSMIWKELSEIRSISNSHERSIERIHIRMDRIIGGRDADSANKGLVN